MIVPMIKYNLVLFRDQKEDFLQKLQELGLVDITVTGWEPNEEERALVSAIDSHKTALERLKALAQEEGFTPGTPYGSGEEAYQAYLEAANRVDDLTAQFARVRKEAEELKAWGEFDPRSIAELKQAGIELRYFFTYTKDFNDQRAQWEEAYTVEPINETGGITYFVVVAAPGEDIQINAQETKIVTKTYHEKEQEATQLESEKAQWMKTLARCATSVDLIAEHCNRLKEQLQFSKAAGTAHEEADGTLLVLEGWATRETSAKVDEMLETYPNLLYLKSDPTPEDNTPVQLKNNRFARIFEMVGDMYARPKYGTLDLTPFFAPFYMLFFGICLNDAGYGLILLILGLLMFKTSKGPMMRRASWFATLCAVATIAFGLFCGSFFGLNLKEYFPGIPFFDFQGNFFGWALAIGIVQILLGMLLKVITTTSVFGFRYARGSLGWFLVVLSASVAAGLPMLNEGWEIPFFTTSSPAFYALLIIGAVLMFFFNSPGKNPLVNFGTGLWDAYNNLTGILSDVLSYIRLFAIGLSGGILATVFNSLAAGLSPDIPVVKWIVLALILLIGHGINLFMSAISSFVHPMRLTFVEFYKNAGFEIANRTFNPLRKIKDHENN